MTAPLPHALAEPLRHELRHLERGDGASMHALVRDGGGLDHNSPYAYVLGERFLAETSVAAVGPSGPEGFVLGLIPPPDPDTLFVWQVGVAPHARGRGLGSAMLRWLVASVRPRYLEATVTPDNTASHHLFAALARHLDTGLTVSRWAEPDELGDGDHGPEDLHRIGPIATSPA